MVEDGENGTIKICKKLDHEILARQAAPSVYDINGSFYFYRRNFFEAGHTSVVQDNRSIVFEMDHVCFDVDAPLDFILLKYLIESGNLGFELK
jgi:CMP-N-acetylneuraminic acid synthetase